MTKRSKLGFLVLCALAGAVLLLGGSPAVSQRQPRIAVVRDRTPDEQPPDPYLNAAVLVEAFVVQVDLSALYEMGVSPLGQEPHAVSVNNILACLKDTDKATVLAGAKAVGLHQSQKGQVGQRETTYRKRSKTVSTNQASTNTVEYRPYDSGQNFEVWPTLLSDTMVRLQYEFAYSGVQNAQRNDWDAPPDTVSWSWEGPVSMNVGEPAVVGAAQNEDSAVFLILTAHIANRM